MASFELDKEMEKDVFRLVTSVGQRKILSPQKELNSRPPDRIPRSDALPSTVSEGYYEVHMTRVLHTARISNVDSVMFVNRKRKMQTHEETNLRPSDSALRCSTTEPQKLYGERGLLRSSYDTYSIHKHDAIDIDDPSSMQDA